MAFKNTALVQSQVSKEPAIIINSYLALMQFL